MRNSNLIKILKTFSKEEFIKLDKLIHSPYFNTSLATEKCFDIIKSYYPSFEDINLSKEHVFSLIHAERKYNDTLIRKYISNIIKLAEEYLTLKTVNKKGRLKKRFLLEELRLRKLHSYYERKVKDSESDFSNDVVVDRDYFIDKYFHEHEKIYHYVSVNKQIKIPPNIIKRSNYLVYFFIQELVHNKMDIKVNEWYLNYKKDNVLINNIYSNLNIENIAGMLNEKPFEDNLLQLYFHLSKVLWLSDDSSPEISKKLFQNLIKSLDSDLKNLIFAILVDYYIYKINSKTDNNKKFNVELFNIYILMLDENIFLYPDNNFKMVEFRNILVNALVLNKSEWAFGYVKKYSQYLDEKIRTDIMNFSYAKIYSSTEQHEKVLKYLSKIKHEDFLYQFDIKNMLMFAYYKLDMFEQGFSLIDSYKKLLHNNINLSERRKKVSYNFINYYTKLIKIKSGDKKLHNIAVLKSKIQNESNIINKEWLIEEANILEGDLHY